MSVRIEHDSYIVLWLVVGESGANRERILNGGAHVNHPDVEMGLHLLRAGLAGPNRRFVVFLELEREVARCATPILIADQHVHPGRRTAGDLPTQQALVELSQRLRVRAAENHTQPTRETTNARHDDDCIRRWSGDGLWTSRHSARKWNGVRSRSATRGVIEALPASGWSSGAWNGS